MSEPKPVTIESALSADHTALPWVVGPPAGPAGGALPAKTQKCFIRAKLSGVAGVTMPLVLYGRDRWDHTAHILTTIADVAALAGGIATFEVDDPERWDRIAGYVTLATWNGETLDIDMVCSERPGALASVWRLILTYLAALYAAIATIGSAVKGFGVQIAGSDGTNARLFRLDADGHVQVDVLSGGGTVGGALEATQGDVKTAVQLIDDAVATLGSASPAKSFQVTRPDPTYETLGSDLTTNHADLPGTATGPAGVAIPAWARKAVFQAFLTAGGGGVTVPVTIYLRRKNTQIAVGGSRWIAWAVHTNIDTETAIADTWLLSVDDPEPYDMIAGYIAGSAGVYEVQIGVAFAA